MFAITYRAKDGRLSDEELHALVDSLVPAKEAEDTKD